MFNRISNISKKQKDRKRYYKNLQYPEIPLSSNDIYVLTTDGDRLDLLANQFYNDVNLWWVIAVANPSVVRRDSYYLKSNIEIRIPSEVELIEKEYKKLNR